MIVVNGKSTAYDVLMSKLDRFIHGLFSLSYSGFGSSSKEERERCKKINGPGSIGTGSWTYYQDAGFPFIIFNSKGEDVQYSTLRGSWQRVHIYKEGEFVRRCKISDMVPPGGIILYGNEAKVAIRKVQEKERTYISRVGMEL